MLRILIFLCTVYSFAQPANVFLSRDYWSAQPSIKTINSDIAKGNDISESNKSNFDATAFAILTDNPLSTIEHLLKQKGNSVNKMTHDGRTYIFWAANRGNLKLMEFLVSKGAKTDLTDDKGNSILNFAAAGGQKNLEIYDYCLKLGADLKKDLNPQGANALLIAAAMDTDYELIPYFVSKGLDLNSVDREGRTAFDYAASSGNIEYLKKLKSQGVAHSDQALIFASQGTRAGLNTIDVFEYLETLKIPVNTISKDGNNPLHSIASRGQDENLFNYFLKHGVDVNQQNNDGNTAFMNAIVRNNTKAIDILKSHATDFKVVNKKGESALALAVQYSDPEVVSFLLDKKADILVEDLNGNTLAYYLMRSFAPKKIKSFENKHKVLVDAGLEMTKIQGNGDNLYHLALLSNTPQSFEWVRKLYKADINAVNKEGLTVLHKAAMTSNDTELLNYLVKAGAHKATRTEFDETAYDLASENEILIKNKSSLEFLK